MSDGESVQLSPSPITIRDELESDRATIHAIIDRAFTGMPYAAGDEAELVDHLRQLRALDVSLVAVVDGKVVGQIAFSPARAADSSHPWFALGPVSVLPEHQRSGIGETLVRAGLERIIALGAVGCILTGNPDYYVRFGFEVSPENTPPNEPPEFFMVKRFRGEPPTGAIFFHDAFHGAY